MTNPAGPIARPDTGQEATQLRELIRFGWAVAELRGRLMFGDNDPAKSAGGGPSRGGHALPLFVERTAKEQLIEVKKLVPALAKGLDLTLSGAAMKDRHDNPPASKTVTGADRVITLGSQVPYARNAAHRKPAWDAFAEALYQWDADIQDKLAIGPYGQASAYQLGRGLAECTWALDPAVEQGQPGSWQVLLGTPRCLALTQLLERLASFFPDMSAKTVMGSLAAWQRLTVVPEWRNLLETPTYLRRQALVWRDLLVTGSDPDILVQPQRSLEWRVSILPLARELWVEFAGIAFGVVLLVIAAYFYSQAGTTGPSGAVTGVLGAAGITSATVSAKAKSTVNDLVGRIQTAVHADELTLAATNRPPAPKSVRAAVQDGPVRLQPGKFAQPLVLDATTVNAAAPALDEGPAPGSTEATTPTPPPSPPPANVEAEAQQQSTEEPDPQ